MTVYLPDKKLQCLPAEQKQFGRTSSLYRHVRTGLFCDVDEYVWFSG